MTAVIECFLINAYHMRPFALENRAEMKHWKQFSISKLRKLCVSIIFKILIGCQPAEPGSSF